MSTQLNAQQGLTNLTPIKVIHILISLAIMVCFKFVPAAEPLTPLGVEVIGIFLGMLYGWLIANDSFWPRPAFPGPEQLLHRTRRPEGWLRQFHCPAAVLLLRLYQHHQRRRYH